MATKDEALKELARRELARREAAKPEQPQAPSFGQQLLRQAGLGARGLVQGALSVPGMLADVPAAIGNLPFQAYDYLRAPKMSELVTGKQPSFRFPEQNQAISQALTSAGLPQAQTIPEKVSQFGVEAMASGAVQTPFSKLLLSRLGLSQVAQPPAKTKPPTADQLKQYAHSAYKQADDAGVVIKPQSYQTVVSDIGQSVKDAGFSPKLHPRVAAALEELDKASGQPLTLQDAEILRRIAKNASASTQPDERRLAGMLVDKLDKYVSNLTASDVISGNPEKASQALGTARNLWSRMSKADTIETLVERAHVRAGQFSGSGFENAIRTEFRQLALNPKRMRLFTPAEQEAIRKVSNGGTINNILRMIGKAAPTGIVSSALGSGAGYALGGPGGAMAVPAVGFGARQAATALTLRNARLASELMRAGAAPAAVPLAPRLAPGLIGGASVLPPYLIGDQNGQ